MNELVRMIKKSDEGLFFLLNHNLHSKSLLICMRLITKLGSIRFSVLICLFFFLYQLKTDSMIGFQMIITAGLSQIIVQLLKHLVNRPRPYQKFQNVNAQNPPKCKYSFPSGHTCAAFTIALVLAYSFPVFGFIALFIAALVGVSRVFLGFHYPTDVLVGGTIAYLTFIFVYRIILPVIPQIQFS